MQGLVQKSGYIKPGGGAGHYAEYIGTRDGVELLNAGDQYLKYIAERPRSHGLFSNRQNTSLDDTMKEVSSHPAPVWTFIYSLKREDAVRLGYDFAESWRKLLLAHQTELAEAMKISPNQFRWCAAFHDEKHHPHIHMMVWSADSKQGYLTEQGIEAMRSKLTNDIFQDELLHLCDDDTSWTEQEEAVQTLEQLWVAGFTVATHQLGKLLQGQKRIAEAVEWYEQAAAQGNQYASYRLGKLYVPKDTAKAIEYLTQAAECGNQYAQYALGKLYLDRQDQGQAHYWFSQSAAQGNGYAQFFLDRWDSLKPPSVMLSVTHPLHHMSEIFQDNSVPPQAPVGQQVDRKLRIKISEKKIAMGHKPDDHEECRGPSMSM